MPIKQSSSRANKKQKSACGDSVRQQCHCGQSSREIECGQDVTKKYNCGKQCGKKLDCGKHFCESTCHPMPCQPCPLLPSQVQFCPCGKTPLSSKTCFDHVQTCDRSCGKVLPCSTPDSKHTCRSNCHVGPCPPCEKTRRATCICGKTSRVDCKDVNEDGSYVCQTPCNKIMKCGRHNCTEPKCQCSSSHKCDHMCDQMLKCGIHKCTEKCHKGPCKPCSEISNEKLTCHCGSEVIEPPRKCGAPPPVCSKPCAREHMCDHETHTCHNEKECPPCTVPTNKSCIGRHKTLSDIPCHETDVSCGVVCGKPLPCGYHTCRKKCHSGECLESGAQCKQRCQISLKKCGHKCGRPCHVGSDCTENILCHETDVSCGVICGKPLPCGYHTCRKKCHGGECLESGEQCKQGNLIWGWEYCPGIPRPIIGRPCGKIYRSRLPIHYNIGCFTGKKLEFRCQKTLNKSTRGRECGIICSAELLHLARIIGKLSFDVEDEILKFVRRVRGGSHSGIHELSFRPMRKHERKLIHLLASHYGCLSESQGIKRQRYTIIYTKRSFVKEPDTSLRAAIAMSSFTRN